MIHPLDIQIPNLPDALHGLRLLQITDLHIRRHRPVFDRLIQNIRNLDIDLLLFIGDYMHHPGDEPVAHETVSRILASIHPNIATLGVWGNHDTAELRHRLRSTRIIWLENDVYIHESLPLHILGVDCAARERSAPQGDLISALLNEPTTPDGEDQPFRLLLAHIPTWLPPAAEADIPLVLSGHTHCGQCRPPAGPVLYNATPGWPNKLSSGILQCRKSFAVISRGVGESFLDGLRFFCKPHTPLITLQKASTPIQPTDTTTCIQKW